MLPGVQRHLINGYGVRSPDARFGTTVVVECGVPTHVWGRPWLLNAESQHVLGPRVCRPKTGFGTPRRLNNHGLDGVAHKVTLIFSNPLNFNTSISLDELPNSVL